MTDPDTLTPVHAAALAFAAAGCSVVPARANGSKAPLGVWAHWQTTRPDFAEIEAWLRDGHPGIGVVCGAVSGGLVMVELEGRAVTEGMLTRAAEIALAAGDADLWRRILAGYTELTPSGGVHILYRISDAPTPGNQKLARRPGPTPNSVDVLAETRGEGGYVVVAPSHGPTHPTGKPWVQLSGAPATIPNLTIDEHNRVCAILRTLDAMPAPETVTLDSKSAIGRVCDEATPGDDYNQRHTWHDVLAPHGWQPVRARGTITDWCRPGKSGAVSATTGYGEHDLLYVFTTSTLFDSERSYSRFAAYALLEHGGSFADAARQLRREGYGAPRDVLAFTPLMPYTPSVPQFAADNVPVGGTLPHTQPPDVQGDAGRMAVEDAPPTGTTDYELALAGRRAQLEQNEYEQMRARHEARKRFDAEIIARDFTAPITCTLREELALPDEPVRYRIDRVMPVGSNVLLTAKYKTGKTTMIGNLAKSLADGGQFLHKFDVDPLTDGRTVCLFNYELSRGQYRRWLRELGVVNVDAVSVAHLRGVSVPLTQAWAQEWVAARLEQYNAAVWVVDPFARAMTGSGDENKNTDVGEFVAILDQIKERVGVDELVMPTHTGRSEEAGDRARGATRLNDWADVQWLLTKDEEGIRFFSADGRDVDVDQEKIAYDETVRSYKMGGGDMAWEKRRRLEDAVLDAIKNQAGINASELLKKVGGRKELFLSARDRLRGSGLICTEEVGPSTLHYTGGLREYVP